MHACMLSCFSCVQLFEISWPVTCQTPLFMGFSKQENWSGLPCLPPGDLPDPGIKPVSPATPALQVDSSLLSHWGIPRVLYTHIHKGRFIISYTSLIDSVSLENPDIAPKLPFCVWSILHPMSHGKYIIHHLRNAKDHKCHQLPMQLQFRRVTQAWPVRCTTPDIGSGAGAAKKPAGVLSDFGRCRCDMEWDCESRADWSSSTAVSGLWCQLHSLTYFTFPKPGPPAFLSILSDTQHYENKIILFKLARVGLPWWSSG